MPRTPIPLIRTGGFKEAERLYVLSYEGNVTEKKYFNDLRHSDIFDNSGLIEIIALKRPENRGSDPFSVKKLLKEAKSEYGFKATDEFWLIIDRDNWETTHKLSFSELVAECKKEQNFYLAMSNPCFEVWLILHLKDLSEATGEEKQLILDNAKIGSKNYVDKLLTELQDGRGYNKRPNPNTFLPLTATAIERAKAIDNPIDDYPKGIGTHVYKLVEQLVKKRTN